MFTIKAKILLSALCSLLCLSIYLQAGSTPSSPAGNNATPVTQGPNGGPLVGPIVGPINFPPGGGGQGPIDCIRIDIDQDGIIDFDSCEEAPRPDWYIHTDRRGAKLP